MSKGLCPQTTFTIKSHAIFNKNRSEYTGAGDAQNDGQRRQDADRRRGQAASLVRDRLLVAANAALASLAGNADTHFAMVNEGAAPALVAALQHGTLPCHCAWHACPWIMPLLLSF